MRAAEVVVLVFRAGSSSWRMGVSVVVGVAHVSFLNVALNFGKANVCVSIKIENKSVT